VARIKALFHEPGDTNTQVKECTCLWDWIERMVMNVHNKNITIRE